MDNKIIWSYDPDEMPLVLDSEGVFYTSRSAAIEFVNKQIEFWQGEDDEEMVEAFRDDLGYLKKLKCEAVRAEYTPMCLSEVVFSELDTEDTAKILIGQVADWCRNNLDNLDTEPPKIFKHEPDQTYFENLLTEDN